MSNSNDENFITENGALKVRLEPGEVTWFEFLWFSRATPSPNGGWNFRSYWWERGVRRLVDDGEAFVTQWTKNSLQTKALPQPRVRAFMFDRLLSSRAHLEESLKLRKSLNEATEHELNYGLCKGGLGIEQPDGISLLGYEIPLADESEGQLKIDLFGVSLGDDAIEIVELKKANNTGDSPLMALTEAICYALQTLRCRENLLNEAPTLNDRKAFARKAFEQINLTLLAPADYWLYWGKSSNLDQVLRTISETLQPIVNRVNEGITGSVLKLHLRKLKPSPTPSN